MGAWGVGPGGRVRCHTARAGHALGTWAAVWRATGAMEGIDAAQLAALQKKLSELGVRFVDTLPPAIRRRVRALRGLQAQRDELYEKFLVRQRARGTPAPARGAAR